MVRHARVFLLQDIFFGMGRVLAETCLHPSFFFTACKVFYGAAFYRCACAWCLVLLSLISHLSSLIFFFLLRLLVDTQSYSPSSHSHIAIESFIIAPLLSIVSIRLRPRKVSITARSAACVSFWTPGHRSASCSTASRPHLHSFSRGFHPYICCH